MPEGLEKTPVKRAVARDPLADLGDLAGVLRRVPVVRAPTPASPTQPADTSASSIPSSTAPRTSPVPTSIGPSDTASPAPASRAASIPSGDDAPNALENAEASPTASLPRQPVDFRLRRRLAPLTAPQKPVFDLFATDSPSGARAPAREEGTRRVDHGNPSAAPLEAAPARHQPVAPRREPVALPDEDSTVGRERAPGRDPLASMPAEARSAELPAGTRSDAPDLRGEEDESAVELRYEEAKRSAAAGDLARAIDLYHEVLRRNPAHVRARNNLGVAYDCRGDHDLAITEYLQALELDPSNVQVLCNLGAVYGAKGLYDKAEETLRQAVRLDPKSAEAHGNLGIVCCKKGLYHLATAELKRALDIEPDNAQAFYYLGDCYNHLDRVDEAIEVFERTLQVQPQNHKAYYNLGILFDKKNMPERAMLMYRRARQIQRDSG